MNPLDLPHIADCVVCEACGETAPKWAAHLHPVEFIYVCDRCYRELTGRVFGRDDAH